MVRQKHRVTHLFIWVAALYVALISIAVIYSWALNIHRFDMGLTVSLYVALHYWTAILYFIGAVIICTTLLIYVIRSNAHIVKKITYFAILFCVFTCALFPCNKSRSVLTTNIHDFFAYTLVILMALSFVLFLLFARNKRQKVFATCSLLYAAFFIGAFAFDFDFVHHTIFIWENVIIALFFFELYLESQ